MGGVYISCGSFLGDDKSCSAIQGVLSELGPMADAAERALLAKLQKGIDEGMDHTLVQSGDARVLLPLIVRYRDLIEVRIAPIRDPFEQIDKDHEDDPDLDPTDAKYGKSIGWRYYCVLDLERAFKVSAETGEPAALSWN